MNDVAHKARVALVRTGKMLPFFMCFIVLISYTESFIAMVTNSFVYYDGVLIPKKPISWLFGRYFEYNIQMLVVVCIISIAVRTCIYNKLSCMYLGFNLFEKSWFEYHEYGITIYMAVCSVNVLVCAWLCLKGIIITNRIT